MTKIEVCRSGPVTVNVKRPMCSECAAGGNADVPADVMVQGSMVTASGSYRPFKKNVCNDHAQCIHDDTPRCRTVRRYE